MPSTQDLRETRANVWSQMKEINDRADAEKRDLSAEELTTWNRADADLTALDEKIERQEKFEARNKQFSAVDRSDLAPQNGPRDREDLTYDKVFTSYLKGGITHLSREEQSVLASGAPSVQNALSVGTNTAGGYLVPPGWRDEFIVAMKAYGHVQGVAQVVNTDSGQPLQWPTMNDTGNVGRLLAENVQMSETDVVVGTATLGAYTYSSDLTRVSFQLVNDAAFDVDRLVQTAHAERIGRITNQHFTTGTGTSQPQGIVTGAVSGVTAASATTYTADELIDLVHSVDPAYRNSPRAQFMLPDATLKIARKLKDSQGRYLWEPSLQAGVPSSFYGYGYTINQDMAALATGVKSVLFGDFQAGYVVRIVLGIQTITFNERYADFLQVGHSSYMRCDGKVQNTAAYKALTQA